MSQYFNVADSKTNMAMKYVHGANRTDVGQVESAYELFSDISLQIQQTQESLEQKICYLNTRMKEVNEAREQEIQHRHLLKNAFIQLIQLLPMAVVCLNTSGRVTEANQAAVQLFDSKINNELWRDVIKKEFSPKKHDGLEVSLKNGKLVNIQTQSIGQNPILTFNIAQILIINDLTETRGYQEKLSRERRLFELGKMSASLAHQIRTPLSSAMLYANHLGSYQLDESQQRKAANKLLNHLESIEKQIKDMLFYLRGEIPLEEGALLPELLKKSLESIEGVKQTQDVDVELNIDLPEISIRCHQEALTGAISNLICNALEASSNGDQIEVSSQVRNGDWIISIFDNGHGISESNMKKLFTPFYTTKKNGNGLGLTTARAIIESHGGSLRMDSRENKGTLVEINMPVNSM